MDVVTVEETVIDVVLITLITMNPQGVQASLFASRELRMIRTRKVSIPAGATGSERSIGAIETGTGTDHPEEATDTGVEGLMDLERVVDWVDVGLVGEIAEEEREAITRSLEARGRSLENTLADASAMLSGLSAAAGLVRPFLVVLLRQCLLPLERVQARRDGVHAGVARVST